MNVLHDTLQKLLADVPLALLARDIAAKLRDQEVILSEGEIKLLEAHLRRTTPSELFEIRRWRWWQSKRVVLTFTESDAHRLEKRLDTFFQEEIPPLVQRVIDETTNVVRSNLLRDWPAQSRWQRRQTAGFRRRLARRWRLPLERLRMLLTVSQEFGSGINEQLRGNPNANQPHLVDVLTRSHARACQVTHEIVALLECGLADGAVARWRTLHEIAVVARFIAQHGEAVAERYAAHQAVESLRAATEYKRCQEALAYEPIEESELDGLRVAFDAVIVRYGSSFKNQYGWAAAHLGISDPKFAEIERAAGVGHLRAHYRMASHNVHANPKGVFFKLGLLDETQALLAGPSNAGLADPGHCAAISLAQVSAALSTLAPTLDNLVALRIMLALEAEIGEAFGAAHEKLRTDAA